MFEPRSTYPDETSHTGSYYAASRNDTTDRPALKGQVDIDVCVVGAGFSGLSTALHLAEKGFQVVVVEGAKIGWGASGRNGGQIVNGLNAGLDRIEKRFGIDTAKTIGAMVQEGGDIIRERISKYNIQCDLKQGNIFTAYTRKHMQELEVKQALWRSHGMDNFELLDRDALKTHIDSDVYAGGMIDRTGGHLHPLNLALGEAAAIESLGGTIYEQSPVSHIDQSSAQPVVHTAQGEIHCKTLVLCGNAYLGDAVPQLTSRVMPVSTQIITTEILPDSTARTLLPTDHCVEDVRYILDYFRLTADNRLLFGGGTVYGGITPADIKNKLVPAMLHVYPQLEGVNIDYAWSGNFALSFTRVPQMGRLGNNTYFAHGYSGHGVTGSHLFGRILAEAIAGDADRFDVFSSLPWYPFPGGRIFRAPYSTLGSWWYGLRDKLGF
ncbi:MAG: FAD-binding oxidoreductase [Gammaproteobacteria bacterium]|nr:FAD-binding oxidoreductase [Gammaproteobacteria bacterium]